MQQQRGDCVKQGRKQGPTYEVVLWLLQTHTFSYTCHHIHTLSPTYYSHTKWNKTLHTQKIETLHSRRDEGIKWIILDRILCKKGRGVSKDLIGLIVKLLSFITLKYSIKFTEVDIYTWIAEDSTPMLRKFKCLKVNFTVYRTPLQVIRRRYCVIWAKGRR